MESLVGTLNNIVWGPSALPALAVLCLLAGLFYSFNTRFVQVRMFGEMVRLLRSGTSSDRGISPFQALAVSLSGRVGTGNIAGVAAAIGFGGPGAVFWMWIIAILGAATAYVESTLAQIYKEVDEGGEYRGGPAFYIEKAMGQKWYAWVFAVMTIIACGILLPTVQSNAIGNAVVQTLGAGTTVETGMGALSSTKIITGLVIIVIFGFIIFGGVKRIANFAQVVVPFMALAYIITALAIIVMNIGQLPGIIGLIIEDAFTPMAGFGAAFGWGVKRGVYSNEAGQGTAPHAAAAAEVDHPAQQGLVQAFSIYVDTLFVCTATAFMILITGMYNVESAGIFNVAAGTAANSPAFTQMAIESVMPGFGNPFVAVVLSFFSFTTLMAYYYIAESNVAYIRRSIKLQGAIFILKVVIIAAVFYGTVKAANLAWSMGDIGVGIMAWVNIIGILIIFFLGKPSMKALQDYEKQMKEGRESYSFDPEALGIKNATFWANRNKE